MWDGFNQRKFPRLKLNCEIELTLDSENRRRVKTVTENVGVGGVCVLQDTEIERFSTCSLTLEIPGGKEPVQCQGKVVWAIARRETGKPVLYDIGIEFMEMEDEDRDRVRRFLESTLPKGFQKIV